MNDPSYAPADCCGDDCWAVDNEAEPCWGETAVIDEECNEDYSDCWWVHGCQGHINQGKYEPKLTVVAAAIRGDDGTVFSVPPPGRHHNVVALMAEQGRTDHRLPNQGFLLSDGTFATREQAKYVARVAKQLLDRASKLPELFSEDVW